MTAGPPPVADQRILQGVAATLRWVNVDQDGTPAAASGDVTVGITSADGTTVVAAGTATTAGDETGEYTAALTAAQTADLDLLTVTWTDAGDSSAHTTLVEIVGGYLFTVAELRSAHSTLLDEGDYPTDDIVRRRLAVEATCEWICDVAFVPRYRRVTLSGTGDQDLRLPDKMVRSIAAVTVDGTTYTAAQRAELTVAGEHRDTLRQPDGGVWDGGDANVIVTYHHGYDRPWPDLADAAMLHCRHLLNRPKSGLPTHVKSYSPEGGGSYELDRGSRYRVGIPDVDAVYQRRSLRPVDGDGANATQPAGYARQLQFDPQYGSLFHGGIR